ncbi:MAG TPA: TIGR02281 family clan AA aspartic protease [Novosphingobium sp.]|nr:TIGR02281 family clan AA aspartic protease [Novosphingobium sp.]
MSDLFVFLADQPLLSLAMAAIFLTVLGGMMLRTAPRTGRFVRGLGNLGLTAALLLTIAQVARFTTDSDFAIPSVGLPKQVVSGSETRIPLARDGHFWITAEVNGTPARFMVDTGATLTALSPRTAQATGVEAGPLGRTILLRTANGQTQAQLVTLGEMRFGNVVARDLDAVIAPGLGETNVIGMNLLSRLAGWRVEGRTLVLQPRDPQPVD